MENSFVILNLFSALETPHVQRRVQRVETRGLEKLCNGDCIELKTAKQKIAELVEENRLLKAKLERANQDIRSSQEAQMSQNLRNCCEIDNISAYLQAKQSTSIRNRLKSAQYPESLNTATQSSTKR